ncbi:MAG: hypothetical protein JWM42_1685 [Burkholderia sp.]|nr:hypothetical protein [Burkholderia sp.]
MDDRRVIHLLLIAPLSLRGPQGRGGGGEGLSFHSETPFLKAQNTASVVNWRVSTSAFSLSCHGSGSPSSENNSRS